MPFPSIGCPERNAISGLGYLLFHDLRLSQAVGDGVVSAGQFESVRAEDFAALPGQDDVLGGGAGVARGVVKWVPLSVRMVWIL